MPALSALRLSPFGVARVAAWPLATFEAFGTTAPATLSAGRAFEHAYDAALACDRQALWAMTLDDALFMKALRLASPSATLRARAAGLRREGSRNRALRLTECTLYRYLARAAGRVTPQGLWAGVASVTRGREDRIERCAERCVFAPDLRPFQTLLHSLGLRADYRARSVWQLNPTLEASPEGWRFLQRDGAGRVSLRALHHDAGLSALLARLACLPPAPLEALARQLAGDAVAGRTARCAATLQALADGGALVGGLDLPGAFGNAWQALEMAEQQLQGEHARAWRGCVSGFREICTALESTALTGSVERYDSLLEASERCIAELAARCALMLPVTGVPVQGDRALPWRITLSAETHAACTVALHDYDRCWHGSASPAAVERAHLRGDAARALQGGRSLLAAALAMQDIGAAAAPSWPAPDVARPALGERLRHWQSTLLAARDESILTPLAPPAAGLLPGTLDRAPLGCWLLGLGADGALHAHGASDLPTMGSARHAGLLDLARHDRWLQRALTVAAKQTGLSFAALHAPCEANPNALAAPDLLGPAVAPWHAQPGALDLRGARMLTQDNGRLVLALADDARAWSILAFATAEQQAGDPLSAALLMSGWRDSATRRQRAVDVPTAAELVAPVASARVRLPGGALLTARRSVLREDVAALCQLRGVARFRHWQSLGARLGWSTLLEVSSPQGTALHVVRDSPLAVEALCKGLDAATPFLLVKDVSRDSALSVPGGAAHMVELAMPFVRQER